MARGLAFVASPVGVNAWILGHHVNGYLARTEREGRQKLEPPYSLHVIGSRVVNLLRETARGAAYAAGSFPDCSGEERNMCGIAGFLQCDSDPGYVLREDHLRAMARRLAHRGPDAEGVWCTPDGRVGLAHRRLSILDLSEAGAQPMTSSDGRFRIVFNGEIYNHLDLRTALDPDSHIRWRGHSDTETLLVAIGRWGLSEALRRACGMFALAVWDDKERVLAIARDRMGEKPLYLAALPDGYAFASELPAFQALGAAFVPRINLTAIAEQIATAVVPDMTCALDGVRKIRPGTILLLSADRPDATPREIVFEDFAALLRAGRNLASSHAGETARAAADRISDVMKTVVASQMISDVPLGSFLSGGVDSSLITALMQDVSPRPVRSYTIGFLDLGYDESHHAEAVAAHLGTDHRTLMLREEDALDLIPDLARIYGEPFADSSQIPTLLLCRAAREHVTVALTGDGGDEVFGGYNRHVHAPNLWSRLSRLPPVIRLGACRIGRFLQPGGTGRSRLLRHLAGHAGISASVLDKAARFGDIAANSHSLADVYARLTRACDDPERFLQLRPDFAVGPDWRGFADLDASERLMAYDSLGYLPSDVLVKVDRAAMSVSLEARAPFLDPRVIKAAWSLRLSHRIRERVGKAVLRDILYRHVPAKLVERPKQGFAVPIDAWLRGPLRDWANERLALDRLEAGGVLAPQAVRQLWIEHVSEGINRGALLWSILMLQMWLEEWAFTTGGAALGKPSASCAAGPPDRPGLAFIAD